MPGNAATSGDKADEKTPAGPSEAVEPSTPREAKAALMEDVTIVQQVPVTDTTGPRRPLFPWRAPTGEDNAVILTALRSRIIELALQRPDITEVSPFSSQPTSFNIPDISLKVFALYSPILAIRSDTDMDN